MNKNELRVFSQSLLRHKRIIIVLLSLFALTLLSRVIYVATANPELDVKTFQTALDSKTRVVEQHMDSLEMMLKAGDFDGLREQMRCANGEAKYFIYDKGTLVMWSDNTLGAPSRMTPQLILYPLAELPNSKAVRFMRTQGSYLILALLKIKNEYPTQNEYLENGFVKGFDIDKSVAVAYGGEKDRYPVFSHGGTYLFSLVPSREVVYSYDILRYISMVLITLALVIVFFIVNFSYKWLFHSDRMKPLHFCFSAMVIGTLISICLYFNWPTDLMRYDLFSPLFYASGNMFSSLGHLLIFSCFVFAESVFFFLNGWTSVPLRLASRHRTASIVTMQAVTAVLAVLVLEGIRNVVFNSTFPIVVDGGEITWTNVVYVVLLFFWLGTVVMIRYTMFVWLSRLIGVRKVLLSDVVVAVVAIVLLVLFPSYSLRHHVLLMIAVMLTDVFIVYFRSKVFNITSMLLLMAMFTTYAVYISTYGVARKQYDFYHTIAENLDGNEMLDNNIFTNIMFDELDARLMRDKALAPFESRDSLMVDSMLALHSKVDVVSQPADTTETDTIAYNTELATRLTSTYFRGYWRNYDVKIVMLSDSVRNIQYLNKLRHYENQIKSSMRIGKTHFFSPSNKFASSDYIGRYLTGTGIVYIELRSKTAISSYSYPASLLSIDDDNDITKGLSVARYRDGVCIARRGHYRYPDDDTWLRNSVMTAVGVADEMPHTEGFYSFNRRRSQHFVYRCDNGDEIVISQRRKNDVASSIFFGVYIYITVSFLYVMMRFVWVSFKWFRHGRPKIKWGFASKFQVTFLSLLIASFVIVGTITSLYMVNQYKQRQNTILQNKTHYIQKFMQESYKRRGSLNMVEKDELNFYIQDLASTYETDIHLYDEKGNLIATSQPSIFSRRLMSDYINPEMIFGERRPETLTETIGNLQYFASYAPIANQNKLTLGYVCVPSYYSYESARNQIFNLLAITVAVYMLIMLLSAFISMAVSRQLMRPLEQIKRNLASFKLKGKNEKLTYKNDDEVGQLVGQYNIMVDKLDESADQMAKDERLVAWKQMARQVTHEIKNPLTPMKLTIQMMQRMRADGDETRFNDYFSKSTSMLIEQIESLANIATSFSDFAKMPEARRERTDLMQCVAMVTDLFKNNAEGVEVNLRTDEREQYFILADKQQMKQVLTNLIKNAIQAIPKESCGRIEIDATRDRGFVTISIRDNGIGIDEETGGKIFTPNFTTKSSGMGLGLAIVKNIVTGNDGEIWYDTEVGKGTTFHVRFPLCESFG